MRGQRMKPITKNTLFYGDNLIILREHIPTESVDHTACPIFNSNKDHYFILGGWYGGSRLSKSYAPIAEYCR